MLIYNSRFWGTFDTYMNIEGLFSQILRYLPKQSKTKSLREYELAQRLIKSPTSQASTNNEMKTTDNFQPSNISVPHFLSMTYLSHMKYFQKEL